MSQAVATHQQRTIIVVGNGPVGVFFCSEILRRTPGTEVHLFGDEPYEPYNRVALSQLLHGERSLSQLALALPTNTGFHTHWHTRIKCIDPTLKTVTTAYGDVFSYDELVLATGSRAHVPNLPGVHIPGVYCFRNLKDAQALCSRRVGSRHTLVLGGGLLGIETARAMRRRGNDVTLIHHSAWLMNRQLDPGTAAHLKSSLEEAGIVVRLETSVLAVDGTRNMTGVILRNGDILKADTLILSTGIRPNLELARSANIAVGRGIRINDRLQTSDDNVYAIGECAEINGDVFGLVAPGLEQASILAARLSGDVESVYQQQALATRLKVMDQPVVSIGDIGMRHDTPDSRFLTHEKNGHYRTLRFQRGKLKGAAGIGEWPDQAHLKDLMAEGRQLSLLQSLKFRFTGDIWPASEQIQDHHIICNCRQVSAGALRECCAAGHPLSSTGAGTVCGSCVPLLQQFDPTQPEHPNNAASNTQWLAAFSLVAVALITLFQTLSPFGGPQSYQPQDGIQAMLSTWWVDSEKRQISGFVLLGLTVTSLLLSARKRIRSLELLPFSFWRWTHVILTTLVLAILFFHTGVSEFQGINAWLIYSFWATALLGVGSSLFTHRESASPSIHSKRHKRWFVLAHIIAFWPLPALLSFHVLSVYWF